MISADLIKQLREKTAAGVMDSKKALEEANGDLVRAEEILRKQGLEKAEKKAGRETGEGLVEAYIHQTGKVGSMVEVLCETDFVARTEDFKALAHEIAMQVASMEPKNVDGLLKQEYIRDPKRTISDLVKETIAKLGENIVVKRFERFELGAK